MGKKLPDPEHDAAITERWRDPAAEDFLIAGAAPSGPDDPVLVKPPRIGPRGGIDGLTPLQERFYHGIARGMNVLEAYIAAGYRGGDGARGRASRLMANPVIQARLRLLRRESEDDFTHRRVELRQHVLGQLYALSLRGADERIRLKALELLGKTNVVGLFEKVAERERDENQTTDELRAKLNGLLARLADRAEPIDRSTRPGKRGHSHMPRNVDGRELLGESLRGKGGDALVIEGEANEAATD